MASRNPTKKPRQVVLHEERSIDSRDPLPETAEWYVMCGVINVARGFNVLGDPGKPWAFPPNVRNRAQDLCSELVRLFHDSRIEPRPGAFIERDTDFQRFMGKLNIEQRPAA